MPQHAYMRMSMQPLSLSPLEGLSPFCINLYAYPPDTNAMIAVRLYI